MLRLLSRSLPTWCRILVVLLMALEFGLLGLEAAASQRSKRPGQKVRQGVRAAAGAGRKQATARVRKAGKTSAVARATKKTRGSSRRRVRRSRRARPFAITALTLVRDSSLGQGARYAEYRTNGRTPIVVHALVLDRSIPGNALRLVKGEDHTFGLERLADMAQRFSSTSRHTVFGLVNGNFWRAVRNTLIGPCVIDGEVVEMNSYKKWSSAFFDVRNGMTIDTFSIRGTVSFGATQVPISTVNHRDDQGVVVYNQYAGNTVPYVSPKQIERAFQEAIKDTVFVEQDSTEAALTQDVLRQEIARARRERDAEYPMLKIRVRYLRSPSVNVPLPCEVLSADTGTVTMPIRGAVISVPRSTFTSGQIPVIGDTVRILYSTNVAPQTPFMNALCGTPRLVRRGVAKHEALSEGSTGQRFISHALARCAVGADSSGSKLMLVAVPADRPERQTVGATLQQMAQIMALMGCREALNLDGGGSAGMVVGADHVFFDGQDPLTRRVGLGVGVVKLSKILRGGTR
ncbi:MAG: phosphodiester glycosidase family protein [Candidatus Kapabacteria bacterium]|nr:phosphodiester glycosidase family protein [Candidatus Kapabacteria bacterium]